MEASPDPLLPADEEGRSEYDFRALKGVVRGKYVSTFDDRLRFVRLDDDIVGAFTDPAAVNTALREWLKQHPAVK